MTLRQSTATLVGLAFARLKEQCTQTDGARLAGLLATRGDTISV